MKMQGEEPTNCNITEIDNGTQNCDQEHRRLGKKIAEIYSKLNFTVKASTT
jgi:hypothetical protein